MAGCRFSRCGQVYTVLSGQVDNLVLINFGNTKVKADSAALAFRVRQLS